MTTEDKINTFLCSKKQILLLKGAPGSGKTSACHAVLKRLRDTSNLYAIYIDLAKYPSAIDSLIETALHAQGLEAAQLQKQKMIFILDNYHELDERRNIYIALKLHLWANARFIVSCRTEYLTTDTNSARFSPINNNRIQKELFEEILIPPLTSNNKLAQSEHLQAFFPGMINNPLLLEIANARLTKLNSEKIEKNILYSSIMDEWFIYHEKKFKARGKLLPDDSSYIEDCWNYSINLANQMHALHVTRFLYKPASRFDKQKNIWEEFFSAKDSRMSMLRAACPIQKMADDHYEFIQADLLKYFATVKKNIKESSDINNSEASVGKISSDQLIQHPLNHASIVNNDIALEFFSIEARKNILFKNILSQLLLASQNNKTAATGAANAITILVAAKVSFSNQDLRNINIPGADISYGNFDNTKIQNSDLTNVRSIGTWLRQANLTGSMMQNMQFGKLPALNVLAQACSYSERLFAVASGTIISIYDTEKYQCQSKFSNNQGIVTCMAFRSNGTSLISVIAINAEVYHLSLQDTITNTTIVTINTQHTAKITQIDISPDDQLLVTSSEDGTVKLWEVTTTTLYLISTFEYGEGVKCWAYFNNENNLQIAGIARNKLFLLDTASNQPLYTLTEHQADITTLSFSRDGKWLASGSQDGVVKLWSRTSGTLQYTFSKHTKKINKLTFNHEGQLLASSSDDNTVYVWEIESGELGQSFTGHADKVQYIAFNSTSRILASVTGHDLHAEVSNPNLLESKTTREQGVINFWNVENEKKHRQSYGKTHTEVKHHLFSSNGEWLASKHADESLQVWNCASGHLQHVFKNLHEANKKIDLPINTLNKNHVAFSQTNQLAAYGVWDDIQIQTIAGEFKLTLTGHTQRITAVAFSPDGKLLVSGSEDQTIRIWNVDSGHCMATVNVLTGTILCINFNEVDSILYFSTGSQYCAIHYWKIIEAEQEIKVILCWNSHQNSLNVDEALIKNPINLHENTHEMLKQNGIKAEKIHNESSGLKSVLPNKNLSKNSMMKYEEEPRSEKIQYTKKTTPVPLRPSSIGFIQQDLSIESLNTIYLNYKNYYEQNNNQAHHLYRLGVIYQYGYGVAINQTQAKEYFQLASDKNDPRAMFHLCNPCQKINNHKTIYNALIATALGYPEAEDSLRIALEGNTELSEIVETKLWPIFQKRYNSGEAFAGVVLGYLTYLFDPNNLTQNKKYFLQAGEQGISAGYYNLGMLAERSIGSSPNLQVAAQFYEQAAALGHIHAAEKLGDWYSLGTNFSIEYAKAIFHYKQAAEKSSCYAQKKLAWHYWKGQGVAIDEAKACEYTESYLVGIDKDLTLSQIDLELCEKLLCYYVVTAQQYDKAIALCKLIINSALESQIEFNCHQTLAILIGLYKNGWGLHKDHKKSLQIFEDLSSTNFYTAEDEKISTQELSTRSWNIPSKNSVFIGREKELRELRSHFNKQNKLGSVITGLGGIGKTQLALYYAHNHDQAYLLRVWFQADDKATLLNEYRKFALHYKIIQEDSSEDDMIYLIKKYFKSHHRNLIIFDNACEFDELKDILPDQANNHILITTRRREWHNNAEAINLPVFTPIEKAIYLRTMLSAREIDEYKIPIDGIKHYLPLMLAQIVAYIKRNKKFTPTYETFAKICDEIPLAENDYSYTVNSTWTRSLLAFERDCSEQHLENCTGMLKLLFTLFIALAPNVEIPREIIEIFLHREFSEMNFLINKQVINNIINNIYNNSLIELNTKNNTIILDPMIQRFFGNFNIIYSISTKLSIAILCSLGRLLEYSMSKDNKYKDILLLHIMSLSSYIKRILSALIDNSSFLAAESVTQADIINLWNVLSLLYIQIASVSPDLDIQITLLQDTLHIIQTQFDKSNPATGVGEVKTATLLTNIYIQIGNNEAAQEMLVYALKSLTEYFGKHYEKITEFIERKDWPEIAKSVLIPLAAECEKLKDNKTAITLYEYSLKLLEVVFGPDSYQLSSCINDLANSYASIGNVIKRKLMLERALHIEQMYPFRKDFIDVAYIYYNLANTASVQRKFHEAKMYNEQCIRIFNLHIEEILRLKQAQEQAKIISTGIALKDIASLKLINSLDMNEESISLVRECFENLDLNFDDPLTQMTIACHHANQEDFIGMIWHTHMALNLLSKQNTPPKQLALQHHNLGGCYHGYAIQQKIEGNDDASLDNMQKAHQHFLMGINLSPYPGIRTQYANFLLFNERILMAISELEDTLHINNEKLLFNSHSEQKADELQFISLEKVTLDSRIQIEVDFWKTLKVKSNVFAFYLLIQAYAIQNMSTQAEKALIMFIKYSEHEDDALTFSLLGHAHELVQDHKGAILNYQQALKLKPDYAVAIQQIEACTSILEAPQAALEIGYLKIKPPASYLFKLKFDQKNEEQEIKIPTNLTLK